MFNKKFAATIFLSLFLIFSFGMTTSYASVASEQNNEIKVLLDGKTLNFDVPPVELNGRTLVPLRAIFEALGAKMEWDNNTSTVTGTKGSTKVVLQIDNPTAYVNGNSITLSTPGTLVNNKTMVPARFIAESMNCVVDWDESTKTVVIIPKKDTLFADKNLENAVKSALKSTKETITADDVKNLKFLQITNKSITSLEGLQYCTNLQTLYLDNCEIKDIAPLSSLIKLDSLFLSSNQIKDISPLSTLVNLKCLFVNNNNISNIEALSKLTHLESLSIIETLVQDITPLSSLNNLYRLYLNNTQINDISALKNNIQLKILGIVGTSVIDLAPLKSLKNLDSFYLTSTSKKTEINDDLYLSYHILNSKAKDIVDKLIKPGMNDLEKEMVLHDYIVTHTKYDHDGYVNGTIAPDAHTAYGVLVNGVGVCDGYSYTLKALLNLVNIESLVIHGESLSLSSSPGGHAWNMVKIDGKYYQVDATWDDLGTKDSLNDVYHRYFNISNKQISVNHKFNQDFYPVAADDNNDYEREIKNDRFIAYTKDAIYTSNSGYLYKIDTATQTAKKLCEDQVSQIAYNDGWIYYINYSDGKKIYKIKTDGTSRTLLDNDSAIHIMLINNNIYYIDTISDSRKIKRMDLDGKNKVTISNDTLATALYYLNDSLYYKAYSFSTDSRFYKMNSNGNGKTVIINEALAGFTKTSDGVKFSYGCLETIKDGWIYYINASDLNKLYKIKIDGTGRTKLTEDSIESFEYELIGNWIYYKNSNDSNKIYKIKTDGTQKTLVDTN